MKKIFILLAFLISGIALKAQTRSANKVPPMRTSDPVAHTDMPATTAIVPKKTGGGGK